MIFFPVCCSWRISKENVEKKFKKVSKEVLEEVTNGPSIKAFHAIFKCVSVLIPKRISVDILKISQTMSEEILKIKKNTYTVPT